MAGEASEEEYEELAQKQRLKAALHYTVGRVCEEVEGVSFSRELIATVSETTFKQCQLLAMDLEQFAKHAKRTTVSVEDVKLCCRRSTSLMEFISSHSEKLREEREGGEGRRRGRKGQKGQPPPAVIVDDSDEDLV